MSRDHDVVAEGIDSLLRITVDASATGEAFVVVLYSRNAPSNDSILTDAEDQRANVVAQRAFSGGVRSILPMMTGILAAAKDACYELCQMAGLDPDEVWAGAVAMERDVFPGKIRD